MEKNRMEKKVGTTKTQVRKVIICVLVSPEIEIIRRTPPPPKKVNNDKASILTRAIVYISKPNRGNSKFKIFTIHVEMLYKGPTQIRMLYKGSKQLSVLYTGSYKIRILN